jgi:hypothetical protein
LACGQNATGSESVAFPKRNVLSDGGNRSKVGFYQHFRHAARAIVACRQHSGESAIPRAWLVERMQVVSL